MKLPNCDSGACLMSLVGNDHEPFVASGIYPVSVCALILSMNAQGAKYTSARMTYYKTLDGKM